ncbi:hypothetical protein GQ53DRAFT_466887 [Thozetella sp. PMI_491]|nr:hypothetical protein GQ53DRAFT_466887 [Thozetella sp. PMI_491]
MTAAEDFTAPAQSAAMAYITCRPPPAKSPTDTIVFNLPVTATTTTVRFPEPELVWMHRDVDKRDWNTFIKQLGLQSGPAESDGARRRRIDYVVREWNDEFFKPRGLRVQPSFGDGTEVNPNKGFGFKAGNSFVGFAPHSSGFGLRLPGGMLLGVATGKSDDHKD